MLWSLRRPDHPAPPESRPNENTGAGNDRIYDVKPHRRDGQLNAVPKSNLAGSDVRRVRVLASEIQNARDRENEQNDHRKDLTGPKTLADQHAKPATEYGD